MPHLAGAPTAPTAMPGRGSGSRDTRPSSISGSTRRSKAAAERSRRAPNVSRQSRKTLPFKFDNFSNDHARSSSTMRVEWRKDEAVAESSPTCSTRRSRTLYPVHVPRMPIPSSGYAWALKRACSGWSHTGLDLPGSNNGPREGGIADEGIAPAPQSNGAPTSTLAAKVRANGAADLISVQNRNGRAAADFSTTSGGSHLGMLEHCRQWRTSLAYASAKPASTNTRPSPTACAKLMSDQPARGSFTAQLHACSKSSPPPSPPAPEPGPALMEAQQGPTRTHR